MAIFIWIKYWIKITIRIKFIWYLYVILILFKWWFICSDYVTLFIRYSVWYRTIADTIFWFEIIYLCFFILIIS